MSEFEATSLNPASLLAEYAGLFDDVTGPVLDLACGEGNNGIYLAKRGCSVVLADRSKAELAKARRLASVQGVDVQIWEVDFEKEGLTPLYENHFQGMIVFRYLHRPLIPWIKNDLER